MNNNDDERLKQKSWIQVSLFLLIVAIFLNALYYSYVQKSPNRFHLIPKYYYLDNRYPSELSRAIKITDEQGNKYLDVGIAENTTIKLQGQVIYYIPQGYKLKESIIYLNSFSKFTVKATKELGEEIVVGQGKRENYPREFDFSYHVGKNIYGWQKDIDYTFINSPADQDNNISTKFEDRTIPRLIQDRPYFSGKCDSNKPWQLRLGAKEVQGVKDVLTLIVDPCLHNLNLQIEQEKYDKLADMDLLSSLNQAFNQHFAQADQYAAAQLTILAWGMDVFKILLVDDPHDFAKLKKYLAANNELKEQAGKQVSLLDAVNDMPGVDYETQQKNGDFITLASYKSFSSDMEERDKLIKLEHRFVMLLNLVSVIAPLFFLIKIIWRMWQYGLKNSLQYIFKMPADFYRIFSTLPGFIKHKKQKREEEKALLEIERQLEEKKKQKEEQDRIAAEQSRQELLLRKEQERIEKEEQEQVRLEQELADLRTQWQEIRTWDYQTVIKDKRIQYQYRQQIEREWPSEKLAETQFEIEDIEQLKQLISQTKSLKRLADSDMDTFSRMQDVIISKIAEIQEQAVTNESVRRNLIPFIQELKEISKKAQNNNQRINDLKQLQYRLFDQIIPEVIRK